MCLFTLALQKSSNFETIVDDIYKIYMIQIRIKLSNLKDSKIRAALR